MELISSLAYSAHSMTFWNDCLPRSARFLLDMSRLAIRRYDALVVCVRFIIVLT